MLENARRQLTLVILVAAAAIAALLSPLELPLGLDLEGGTQLIYEIDVENAKAQGLIPVNATEAEISGIIDSTIDIISRRIDPQGTLEAVVTRRGDTGILIELPKMDEIQTRAVEAQIENLGRLELRIVADETYNAKNKTDDTGAKVTFDLQEEKRRLREWLALEGVKQKVLDDPVAAIQDFHQLAEDEGGRTSQWIKWYPRLIEPKPDRPDVWDDPFSWTPQGPLPDNLLDAVPAFDAADWNGGVVHDVRPADAQGGQFLVEYVPVNMHERHFEGSDLDASAISRGIDEYGKPCIHYAMAGPAANDYANWSEEYIGQQSAIILNGIVHSAPTFQDRLSGGARITSRTFTNAEVDELVRTLRTGSLRVKPVRQSREVIGATLGQTAIERAFWSMGAGALIVLVFILSYYRRAGLVAFAALMLNVLMIVGALVLLRSTLTLPGIAGIILTMAMAIDSNILIYERIREELERGKQLLQACRAGFDRAMVTIIDSNLTTFVAGAVLYQVGVGPIRGFAVTLMIGIVSTLFTAYFVSRVVFHYLLEYKILKRLSAAAWLRNANFDFMRWTRPAFALSVVVLLASVVIFAVTPSGTKYAIDFTGGANLKVALAQPMTQAELRAALEGSEAFAAQFPDPIVNTVGEVQGDTATQFAIRIKLTDEQRKAFEALRQQQGEEYEAPYTVALREALGDRLVDEPYSDARTDPNDRLRDYASIVLHFARDVRTSDLHEQLAGLGPERVVRSHPPGSNLDVARNFIVEWDVERGTSPDELFPRIQAELSARTGTGGDAAEAAVLRGVDGAAVNLSDPIPESSQIGGRMVGELRNSAVSALVIAMFLIVMYVRVRFHEYKYGIAAVAALVHDVLVALGGVVLANALGLVDAEISLTMIAAFLTIIGYSINDTIVIFDRVRENLSESQRLGERIDRRALLNLSLNQTLSRTILTTATTLFVVLAQFLINFGSGTDLEGFTFALLVGLVSGTYSTVFIAGPIVHWLWLREGKTPPTAPAEAHQQDVVAATT